MDRLSDFKPLAKLRLPDLGEIATPGLTVLVGPNSSGKSQLLRDMYHRLAGEPRALVVAEAITIDKPPYEPFIQCLENEGYFRRVEDESGAKQLRPLTMYLGSGQGLSVINLTNAQSWHNAYSPETQNQRRNSEFLNHFGRLLVTGLFLDRRLTALAATGLIDFDTQPPSHDLHALYLNDEAKAALLAEMVASFSRAVWPDMSRGSVMSLKVSDAGLLPSAEDRMSHKKMAEFRSIETEGDGMKSYVATCLALLLGQRPVCLIDEPEMCLHPPQAYNLGRFIGRFGASTETATFVATHSSHLLRGILQTASKVQIVRLTRRDKRFAAYRVPPAELAKALSRPTLRAEAVLDGVFADAVIVVEADGDRVVYQAAWETLKKRMRMDVHFTTVGGTGGIADTCELYNALHIPIAVVADLDMLIDVEKMVRVAGALISDDSIRSAVIDEVRRVAAAIKTLPPTIQPAELVSELQQVATCRMDWSGDDDLTVKRQLVDLVKRIDRMRCLKEEGVDGYRDPLRSDIRGVLQRLRNCGLFLVPVGELEQWLKGEDVQASKRDKKAWATAAAQTIHAVGPKDSDVWSFVAAVGEYLKPGSAPHDLAAIASMDSGK